MALASAATLRASNPSIPYTIVTDIPLDETAIPWHSPNDQLIVSSLRPDENRTVKTGAYARSPYARSLLLDADTLVLDDISFIPFALQYFDVLARVIDSPAIGPRTAHQILESRWTMDRSAMCNGGVVAFRSSPGAESFFQNWALHFQKVGSALDQPSLLEALYTSEARFFPLPAGLNAGARTPNPAIWHYKRRADRTVRRLVSQIGRATLADHGPKPDEIAGAMRPKGWRKRLSLDYLRDRHRDWLKPSPASPIKLELSRRGWISA